MQAAKALGVIVLLVLIPSPGGLFAAERSPADVVRAFYAAYEPMQPYGIPRPEDMAILAPFLSPRIQALIENARKVQAEFAAKHPDEKPPFADGDLFSSLFEGFRTFSVGKVETLADGSFRVAVDLAFWEGDESSGATRWKDAVIVVREGDELLIDDFEFLGSWNFAQRGLLSDILRSDL